MQLNRVKNKLGKGIAEIEDSLCSAIINSSEEGMGPEVPSVKDLDQVGVA